MEHLTKKKEKSRVDVYMEHLQQVSNKEIYDIDDKDVLEFLIFKDINGSKNTLVHKDSCPYIGTTSLDHCADKIQCGFRHQAESMRIGIVDKLRKGFEEVGRKRPYSPIDQMEIPQNQSWLENIYPLSNKHKGSQGL